MRSWLFFGMLVVGIPALSGCSVLDELGSGAGIGKPAPRVVSAPPDNGGPAGAAGKLAAHTAPADTTPIPKRKPDIVDPKTLVGLDKETVSEMFGEPHSITLSQPALVWSWQTDDCVMRLFFYPDVADRTFKALAYQINAIDQKHKAVVLDTCASRLKWAHAEATR